MGWEITHRATVFIAEEMGIALKRSALSPNIRERMDHSCAVINREGLVVAQAEHIPVHLGSFRVGVRNTLEWLEREGVELAEGDVVVLNDPYIAGTHLNDVMILSPVFYRGALAGYVVNKAHHVDIGGPVYGSVNPGARSIYEEGLVLPPTKIVKKGSLDREVLRIFVSNTKTPEISYGDLMAQIAANRLGIRRILELLDKQGLDRVEEAWGASISYARSIASSEISRWPSGSYRAEDFLELGERDVAIRLELTIRGGSVVADFSGTDAQAGAPINAVLGVTFAAVSYAVRAALGKEVPTNEGFYQLIDLRAPEASLVNPVKPAPVSGGNLETSQRIADTAFLALSKAVPSKIPAAGSGTMMNLMIGGRRPDGSLWAYYETIGGGTGGRPGKPGVSGVHVNMTNTLNTPVEVAERSYPILYTGYSIREGSGGEGLYRGGDGIVRSFRVLEPSRISILSDRFRRGPWSLWGGSPGRPGRVAVKRINGAVEEMPSKFTADLEPGDEVVIETPGGGGWGARGEGSSGVVERPQHGG